MSIAIFYVSAAIWAFLCALVAIVAGAAAGSRTSHWKRGLVGALVGTLFGVILSALSTFVGEVTFFLISLLPDPLDRLVPYFAGILLGVVAVALACLVVGLLEARSVPIVRRCVIVGALLGLVLSIGNSTVGYTVLFVLIPALKGAGFGSVSAVAVGSVLMIATVDLALAVVAFRFVRRRWPASLPATGAET